MAVLGVVVFAVHTWSVRGFLYSVPSFILKYSAGDVLVIFCYHMAFALLETLCVTLLLVLLAALLPAKLLRGGFVHKGTLLVLEAAVAAIFLQYSFYYGRFAFEGKGRAAFLEKAIGGLAVLAVIYLWSFRSNGFQKVLSRVAETTWIMPFIYFPIDAVSVLVVLGRLLR